MSYIISKLSDLKWNNAEAQKLLECVKSKQPVLIHGPPGIGKSSSVQAVANELNYKLNTVNASSSRNKDTMSMWLARVKSGSFKEYILFFDEAESISDWPGLIEILTHARHPVVLACNEERFYTIPEEVKNRCTLLKYFEPTLNAVVEVVREVAKKNGITPTLPNITTDFRASLNNALNGGSRFIPSNNFSDMENMIRKGQIPSSFEVAPIKDKKESLIWMSDNASKFYYGKGLYDYLHLLADADLIGFSRSRIVQGSDLLSGRTSQTPGKISYPFFLKRRSTFYQFQKHKDSRKPSTIRTIRVHKQEEEEDFV